MLLASVCLLAGAGALVAQERIALPPPDPTPAGADAPPPPSQGAQAASEPLPPPKPYVPTPPEYPTPGPYPLSEDPTEVYAGPTSYFAVRSAGPIDNPIFWIGGDGLLWGIKNQPLSVPLLTTGPAALGATAGNLGAPGTVSLNRPLDFDPPGGFRLFAGGWFDCDHVFGLDGSLFTLARQTTGFGASDHSGNGTFVINEPVPGVPFSTQVSAPGIATGTAAVVASSRFEGGDIDFRYNAFRAHGLTLNLLAGYRYLELDETLTIAANSTLLTTTTYSDNFGNVLATAPPGSTVGMIDQFGARSEFSGGQIGAELQYNYGRWFLDATTKLAIGGTREVITVDGFTNVLPVNGSAVPMHTGNYATLQIGRYSVDRFALAPEVQLQAGYQITRMLRGVIGYDFLYLTSVARPGNQIDNNYDGVSHPLVPLASSSFWAQGLTFRLQFSF
jgi:hypothetical protein